jgi:hypothetical protein
MNWVTIVLAIGWLLVSAVPRLGAGVALQTAPAQQASQPGSSPASAAPAPPPGLSPKPCPTVSPSEPASASGCTPAVKGKKRGHRTATADPDVGPTKKVVRDGGTTNPSLAISPGVNQQQASQQLDSTNHLLAMTDQNLKTIESRQLNAGQQDTVKQIRSYMEQSRTAASSGNVQRAYTLANKARMLSGDLVKH